MVGAAVVTLTALAAAALWVGLGTDDDVDGGVSSGTADQSTPHSPLDRSGVVPPADRSTGDPVDAGFTTDPGAAAAPADLAAGSVAVGTGGLVLTDSTVGSGTIDSSTSGTSTFELPTTGALASAMIDRPLRGRVGVAYGRDLERLGAHLRGDVQYLYADLGTQEFALDLGLGGVSAGATGVPQAISTIGGVSGSSVFVADLTGDYFYLSVPCQALMTAPEPAAAQRHNNDYADSDASQIPGVSVDLSAFDPSGCGIGWSTSGVVPFVPLMQERAVDIPDGFGAHLVFDGTMPLSNGLSLDGELFYRFDQGVSLWANGELDVAVPFFEGAVEVSLPAVRGTFGVDASKDRLDLWITATAGSSAADGTPAEALADFMPISGHVDVDGELHLDGSGIEPSSFLQLAGEMAISPAPVQVSSNVAVETFSADGIVRIDADGVTARGTVQASPLAAIALTGSADLELMVPFADPSLGFLVLHGHLAVGGTGLGADAELRFDRDGALARGSVELGGLGSLSVEGRLGVDGFQLTGAVEATLPIGDLDQVAARLVDETSNDQVIRTLDQAIDARVDEIGRTKPAKGSELRNTIDDMRSAFDDIASTRETIAYNDGLIAQLWDDHAADIEWHNSLNDFDKFWDIGPHGVRLAAIVAQIEALKFANTVQYGYIDVANAVVAGTQQAVLAIIGWDDELNALLGLQTEAYVHTLVGNFVATVAYGADAVLDAFGIDGSATGTVTFTVGTEGISGAADLRWCRDGSCSPLAGATVSLTPYVEVCATIVGLPACVRL